MSMMYIFKTLLHTISSAYIFFNTSRCHFSHAFINTEAIQNGGEHTNGTIDTFLEAIENKSNGFDELQGKTAVLNNFETESFSIKILD